MATDPKLLEAIVELARTRQKVWEEHERQRAEEDRAFNETIARLVELASANPAAAPLVHPDVAADDTAAADGEWLSSEDIARRYGLPPESLRKRLHRWRDANKGSPDWREVANRSSNESPYLYRLPAVMPIVNSMSSSGEENLAGPVC